MINIYRIIYILVFIIGIIAIDIGMFRYFLMFVVIFGLIYNWKTILNTYYAMKPGVEYMIRGKK